MIEGTAPYVQNKFSEKARQMMRDKQEAGSTSGSKKSQGTREAKDFQERYRDAMHVSDDGWRGIPASAFRAAAISACRLVGYKMTMAKLSLFIEADGFDSTDGTPLVRITKGEPVYCEMPVRNATGVVDLRARPMWKAGWRAVIRISYDATQFTDADVGNLVMRIGRQVGIGEGRPDSPKSSGMGWGVFHIVNE
jgi:hypothetical protein